MDSNNGSDSLHGYDKSAETGEMQSVFLCGRLGHKATSCVEYNGTLPFLQPGWRSVKSPGGVTMIPPQIMTDRRRAETTNDPGGRVRLSGQY